jgi:hypothetical protein
MTTSTWRTRMNFALADLPRRRAAQRREPDEDTRPYIRLLDEVADDLDVIAHPSQFSRLCIERARDMASQAADWLRKAVRNV